MVDHVAALGAAAARATYAAAGHGEGGFVTLDRISGLQAPNVIDLESRRAQRSRKTDD